MRKLWHWILTGHWPKKFRYPNGIPRVLGTDPEAPWVIFHQYPEWEFIGYTHEGYEEYVKRISDDSR